VREAVGACGLSCLFSGGGGQGFPALSCPCTHCSIRSDSCCIGVCVCVCVSTQMCACTRARAASHLLDMSPCCPAHTGEEREAGEQQAVGPEAAAAAAKEAVASMLKRTKPTRWQV